MRESLFSKMKLQVKASGETSSAQKSIPAGGSGRGQMRKA